MKSPPLSLIQPSQQGNILTLTIDNPPHNQLSYDFFLELEACLSLVQDDQVAALVITGSESVFSKGVALPQANHTENRIDHEAVAHCNQVLTALENQNKPVVAAIRGACLGGGMELALACHLRLCAPKSRLGLPELTRGVVPGLGGTQRLVRVVGEARALEMVLMGDIVSAQRALELNLVHRILPKADFWKQVRIFVKTMVSTSGAAIAEALEMIAQTRPVNETSQIMDSGRRFATLLENLRP